MKQMLSIVCAVGLLCGGLVGCGKKQEAVTPVTTGFSCEVSADYRGLQLKGTLERSADGQLRVSVSEPPTLRDVVVRWDGEEMAMELGGIRIPVNAELVPQGALIKSLLAVLSATPTAGEATESGYTHSGDIDGKAYTLVCAPDTGLLCALSVPEDELAVTFEKVKILE